MPPNTSDQPAYEEPENLTEILEENSTRTVVTFIVLIFGLTMNIGFLWSLLTGDRRSRLRPFLINLALADLLVCCFTIAMELGWSLTVIWTAGDSACRFLSMTKTLGLYLEAFVVLMMSVDRCYVVLFPLKIGGHGRRSKGLLAVAWFLAIFLSIPQAVVFHVEHHPNYIGFTQCVTTNAFSTETAEHAYVVTGLMAMYVVPLVGIGGVSAVLLWTIRSSAYCRLKAASRGKHDAIRVEFVDKRGHQRMSRELSLNRFADTSLVTSTSTIEGEFSGGSKHLRIRLNTGLQLYHTDTVIRRKARTRTLQLSMLIVGAFVICYTPYTVIISVAYLTGQMHTELEPLVNALLMLTLCFSTIFNPLIYGTYLLHSRKIFAEILEYFRRPPKEFIFFRRRMSQTSRPASFLSANNEDSKFLRDRLKLTSSAS